MSVEPIQFRMSEITYAEFVDAMEASGVQNLATANTAEQIRSTVALGWVVARRSRPEMTYEDALALPVGTFVSLDDVEESFPEGSGANDGATPRASLAPGR